MISDKTCNFVAINLFINLISKKMKAYYQSKNQQLKSGIACSISHFCISQIKLRRGLTSFIEGNGINGCYLKPTETFDIRISKIAKILEIKAHYQTDDEFLEDWNAAGEFFLKSVRENSLPR